VRTGVDFDLLMCRGVKCNAVVVTEGRSWYRCPCEWWS